MFSISKAKSLIKFLFTELKHSRNIRNAPVNKISKTKHNQCFSWCGL